MSEFGTTQHNPHQPHDTSIGESEGANSEGHSSPSSPNDDENEYNKKAGEEKTKTGRRKINIEFIEDKSRRHITFSKRKAGIMKKAYELSTLTGTQVLLLVASETGHVYTFATPKLQPLITKPEGKNLIQSCLNAPEVAAVAAGPHPGGRGPHGGIQGYGNEPPIMYPTSELREPPMEVYEKEEKDNKNYPIGGIDMYGSSSTYPPPPNLIPPYGMSSMGGSAGLPRGYMGQQYAQPHSQYPASGSAQGQYAQAQVPYSGGYPANMHGGLPSWNPKQGMQVPLGQMSQAQPQGQSGMIQQSKQGEHSADHST